MIVRNYLITRVCVFSDKEDRNWRIFNFINDKMQTDLPLKIIQNHIS